MIIKIEGRILFFETDFYNEGEDIIYYCRIRDPFDSFFIIGMGLSEEEAIEEVVGELKKIFIDNIAAVVWKRRN